MKAIFLTVAVLALAQPAHAVCSDNIEKSFDKAVKQTFKAIKAQDGTTLLSLFSRDGVAFNGELVKYAELERQFGARTDAYCDFFVCQEQPGVFSRLGSGISISKSVSNNFLSVSGSVTVSNTSFAQGLRLDFGMDAQCHWRLTSVDYGV